MSLTFLRTVKEEGIKGPYIGPRPFGMGSEFQKRFFGRDYETNEILSLVLAHNVSLLYAQSGAGKTSIINAQILPALKARGYELLPILRVRSSSKDDTNTTTSQPSNVYMFNALRNMKTGINPESILNQSLAQFLKGHFPPEEVRRGRYRPQIIIFDQFEELFTLQPKGYHSQHKVFFEQIVQTLENNPVLRVVFVMREEYIARLDSFKDIFPDRLRYRFRLERLKKYNALIAVREPLKKLGLYQE
jgi:hypothetical protein